MSENEAAGILGNRRGNLARIGVTALNLIAPGLGLLRIGRWRIGALLMAFPFFLLVLFTVGMGTFPITSYGRVIFALVVIVCLAIAPYVLSVMLTWRESRQILPVQRWSRWYVLAAFAVVVLILTQLAPQLMHRFYKPFYMASPSMAPTIGMGDKFIADMRWRGPFRRGEILIFDGPDSVRFGRIVAIPGDRIAMGGGVPILNGKPVTQRSIGTLSGAENDGQILVEQLPGETLTHRILDSGASSLDDMPEVTVPPNHLFVLGDNRDRSADSRVPPQQFGAGLVPVSAVIGRPIYIHWSSDHSRIGMRLDR